MKHKIFIISILFVFSVQLNAQINQCDSFVVQFIGEKDNDFEFEIINNSKDTLYLFDSYLNENLYQSKYLHRFDVKEKQCKLSLLPLLPFLSVRHSDRLIIGENKIINKWQVLYHFKTIPPNSKNTIPIAKSAFSTDEYVKEVYPQKLSKFDTIKFHKSKHKKCNAVVVEFALYKNIDLLISKEAFYFDEFNFNKQALSYTVLSVTVNQ
jgi:hypothetical protein